MRRWRAFADCIEAVIMQLVDQGIQVLERVEFFVFTFRVVLGFILGRFGFRWYGVDRSFHNVTILMILFIQAVPSPL